ncbi:MAG: hypothetical protein ACE369_05070 [Roseovarius sp.]
MSNYEQWQRGKSHGMPALDASNRGLFWLLVVVVALGALVFAGSLGNGSAPNLSEVPEGFIVTDDAPDNVASAGNTLD